MLPKKNRLTAAEFKEAYLSGQSSRGDFFSLIFQPVTSESSKFAVVVSKKKAKKAAIRNRIRRQVFAALKEIIQESDQVFEGSRIFILQKSGEEILELPFTEIKKEISSLLQKSL